MNASLAATIGDRYGILARILEFLIRLFFYRDLWEMAPPAFGGDGIYDGTPVVNSRVFDLIVSCNPSNCCRSRPLTRNSDLVAQAGYVATYKHSHPMAFNSPDGPAGRPRALLVSSA